MTNTEPPEDNGIWTTETTQSKNVTACTQFQGMVDISIAESTDMTFAVHNCSTHLPCDCLELRRIYNMRNNGKYNVYIGRNKQNMHSTHIATRPWMEADGRHKQDVQTTNLYITFLTMYMMLVPISAMGYFYFCILQVMWLTVQQTHQEFSSSDRRRHNVLCIKMPFTVIQRLYMLLSSSDGRSYHCSPKATKAPMPKNKSAYVLYRVVHDFGSSKAGIWPFLETRLNVHPDLLDMADTSAVAVRSVNYG